MAEQANHAIYFVGAGLTKSLQKPERPVPMMNDFVSVMADYIDDDVILTMLAHWEIIQDPPYAYRSRRLLDVAGPLADSTDRSMKRRSEFRKALKNRPSESIEDILNNVLRKKRGRTDEVAPVRFRYGINRVFQIIGWDVNLSPLLWFLRKQLSKAKSHVFVSFNYDLVLDYAVAQTLGRPPLSHLYGLDPVESSNVRVLKPHGSLNFIGTLAKPYTYTPYGLVARRSEFVSMEGFSSARRSISI